MKRAPPTAQSSATPRGTPRRDRPSAAAARRRWLAFAVVAGLGSGCASSGAARCVPGTAATPDAFRLRPATYVAVTPDTLYRLEVQRSLADARLVTNRIDGQRLYDRRHWSPTRVGGSCPRLEIDYREDDPDDARAAAPTLRLTISEPVDGGRGRGLRFGAEVQRPGKGGGRVALDFGEVVVKREVGGR